MGKFFGDLLKASTVIAIAGAAGVVAYKAFKKHLTATNNDEKCDCNEPDCEKCNENQVPELDLNDENLKDLD